MKSKIFILSILFILQACTKEGPAGPQGPSGTQGPPGVNANVIGTNSFTAIWTLDGTVYKDSLIAPGITADIVDRGSVQVFIQYGGEWWSLPDMNTLSGGATNTTMFGFGVGYLKLWNLNSDETVPSSPYPPANQFRAVIISSTNRLANPKVDWTNYMEVKKALHLAD